MRFWNVETGQITSELPAHGCRAIAFSTDGLRLLSVSGKAEFTTWEIATGVEISRIAIPSPEVRLGSAVHGDQIVLSKDLNSAAAWDSPLCMDSRRRVTWLTKASINSGIL